MLIFINKNIMEEILRGIYELSPYLRFNNLTDFDEGKVGSPIYGEITMKGVDLLVKKFETYFNEKTVFYDLGSGIGKMVAHIGLKYNVEKSVGIEYSKERYEGSLHIKENFFPTQSNILFINDNFMNVDISDATVIYLDNTVFPNNLLEKKYDEIPIGCLILYKKYMDFIPKKYQSYDIDVVDRTYFQNSLCWHIKA